MELVIDANVLFAALIKESHTRHLILSTGWSFHIPEFLFEELRKHIDTLTGKTGLTKEALQSILYELMILGNIKSTPAAEIAEYMEKAREISPDPDDIAYFALAMKLHATIWSNDKKLQEQRIIRVYTTEELSRLTWEKI